LRSAAQIKEFCRRKKILVTGGAGFIGSHLIEMLVELDAKVTVPIRKTTRMDFLKAVKKDIRIVEADLFDRQCVDSAMKGQEIVMHLAAAKGGRIVHSMGHPGSLFRDNMLSSINIFGSARCASVARCLVVSSACVYPRDSKVPTPEEEGSRDAPEPANAGSCWSKRMQEYLSLSLAEEYGLNVGIVRPFNADGPRDDFFNQTNHVTPGLIIRVLGGENPLLVWGKRKADQVFSVRYRFCSGIASGRRSPGYEGAS
jgi:nucleoside-diphosphate-sugar epimerase